jgi:hypothetical protein
MPKKITSLPVPLNCFNFCKQFALPLLTTREVQYELATIL